MSIKIVLNEKQSKIMLQIALPSLIRIAKEEELAKKEQSEKVNGVSLTLGRPNIKLLRSEQHEYCYDRTIKGDCFKIRY